MVTTQWLINKNIYVFLKTARHGALVAFLEMHLVNSTVAQTAFLNLFALRLGTATLAPSHER